jgi:Flp pilus assembly protein TadG
VTYSARKKHKKTIAQGMMEFALVIPVLLTILVGVMEIGRLMLIFISVTTASRTSARYGSAVAEDGGAPQYKDCTGILNAGLIMSPLSGISTDDIEIEYDHGATEPVGAPFDTCASLTGDIIFGDRILVSVTTQYQPLGVLPFFTLQSFPMKSTSRRLIQIKNPDAFFTATEGGPFYPANTEGPSPTWTFTPPFTPPSNATATFTNTPTITLTPSPTSNINPDTPTPITPTATPIPPPEEPFFNEDNPNAVVVSPSGQNCINAIVTWESPPSGLGYPDNWTINPGVNPVSFSVKKNEASPWFVSYPTMSINIGSINHNKLALVKIQATFPGPIVSKYLVLNIKCKFGAEQSTGYWEELP